jgi:hypothetical protein
MSAPKKDAPTPKRFLTAVQAKGSLGKSTTFSLLLEWYQFAGVPFKAVDSDAENRSLSTRYPKQVSHFDATQSKDAFGLLLAHLPESPVVVFDAPSQFTTDFVAYATHYQMLAMFERAGIRTTMFLFLSNDEDARRSAAELVEAFGEAIDYVMVENPKNFQSDEFRKTGLFDWLVQRGAPVIELPEISKVSRTLWEDLDAKGSKPLTIGEAIQHPDLPPIAQLELSGVRDRMLVQFEDHARLLVPDIALIKNKVTRVNVPKVPQRISRNNPLLAKR